MKKEIALIIGAVVNVLIFYPLAWFPYIGFNRFIFLILPLLAIILFSIYHSANLLMKKKRKKLIIFVSLLAVAIILSFQFVVFLIMSTIPFVV
jgi:hypothetical protein